MVRLVLSWVAVLITGALVLGAIILTITDGPNIIISAIVLALFVGSIALLRSVMRQGTASDEGRE